MQKFTFTVDIVTDSASGINVDAVSNSLRSAVDGVGNIAAIHPVDVTPLKEQGFKVWRARVAGIKEPPKAKVAKPKAVKAEVAATVEG